MGEEVASQLEHDPLPDAREPEPGQRAEHPRRRVDADVREHREHQPLLVAGADAVVGRVLDQEPAGHRRSRGERREHRDQRHLPLALGGVGKEAREPVCARWLRGNGLVSEQRGEEPAGGEQRGRPAFLDDAAAVEHDRAIGDADRREALSRDEDGAAGDRRAEVLDEQPLGLACRRPTSGRRGRARARPRAAPGRARRAGAGRRRG